ncbi:TetR family transcriptional regulator [Sphaerotilus hippei]|uniref:TetR family transcriptional regulator n=1 Tax=Sphaerotilus hippei TaxID=744406 RepID=A0A318H233_9BURK|nr:TetR/AcrR family transcriptional regulator [Sphaerotilus hippei]PXW94696.1 TetR family transcriptional regulator [Sphaerotilus hippei]
MSKPSVPSPSGKTAPAHLRRKAERPQELIDAALALFVEKGFAATRTEEVAQRAGVSKGTLYLYYPSKEELLKAVIEQRLSAEIAAGAAAVAAHTGSATELLSDVLSAWWARVVASDASGVFKLIITEVRNFPDIAEFYNEQVVRPGHALIAGMLQAGIDRGEFRPVDVDATVHSLLLPMVMLCIHKHSLGVCQPSDAMGDPAVFIRHHMDLMLHGLRN